MLVEGFASDPSRPAFINNTNTPSLLSFVLSSPVIVRGYGLAFDAMSSPSPSNGTFPSPPTVDEAGAYSPDQGLTPETYPYPET